jgi:hypothetical protein
MNAEDFGRCGSGGWVGGSLSRWWVEIEMTENWRYWESRKEVGKGDWSDRSGGR